MQNHLFQNRTQILFGGQESQRARLERTVETIDTVFVNRHYLIQIAQNVYIVDISDAFLVIFTSKCAWFLKYYFVRTMSNIYTINYYSTCIGSVIKKEHWCLTLEVSTSAVHKQNVSEKSAIFFFNYLQLKIGKSVYTTLRI